ncbi:septation protein A [Oxalobacteraceae bacterium]|nr:septation protein A [Oxalobacteraceae bacterium]
MKFLFDFFPVLAFFISYKWAGANAELAQSYINAHLSGLLSGGSITPEQSPVIVATIFGILATMVQIAYLKLRGRKVEFLMWVSLFMFVFFGGLTIYFHNDDFIKWKLTVVYWCFGLSLLIGQFVFKKNLMRKSMEQIVQLPEEVWVRLNLAWMLFFLAMGLINLFVAFVLFKGDTSAWVSFKAFGATGIMFVFILGQTFYLSKHMKDQV